MKIKNLFMNVILMLIFIVFTICTAGSISDIKWYSEALNEAKKEFSGKSEIEVQQVDGHTPIDAGAFDKNTYVNQTYSYSDGSEWIGAAKALYDATGLQLYSVTLDAPIGAGTTIQSNEAARQHCLDYIATLPNEEFCIALYEFRGGEDENGNYISVYDEVYYGDKTLDYLSPADVEMIKYVLYNSYDLFPDYETRTIRTWELISNNLRDGYNRNLYNSSTGNITEWDITYYRDERNAAIRYCMLFGAITLFVFILFCREVYIHYVILPKSMKAKADVDRARADRIILESDIEDIPTEADDLVDKYLNK